MAETIADIADAAVEIDEGVWNALEHAGFLLDEDPAEQRIDRKKLRLAIFRHVIKAKVTTKADRKLALTKGRLTKLVIPNADDDATDDVGRKVYQELSRVVWSEANENHSGAVQTLVGDVTDDNGLGYVLVRTRVSIDGNPTDAVYVTTDYQRIAEDFTSPLGQAVTRAARKYAMNATMLIKRGQDARKVRKGLDGAMQSATALATSTVDLALSGGDEA
ncbi:hypothetical protein [Conexibacter woesei]|uniref:hypothetical protein n=1 Tax=Conexibacter woesei TaxID=191495 RepID=UPI00047CFB08|nr:hypothetical protein [Conexibacter woesei]